MVRLLRKPIFAHVQVYFARIAKIRNYSQSTQDVFFFKVIPWYCTRFLKSVCTQTTWQVSSMYKLAGELK